MLNSGQDIRHRLAIARLPAMPHILIQLLKLCQGSELSSDGEVHSQEKWLNDCAELIAKDAAITIKIMGAATRSLRLPHRYKPGLREMLLALGMDAVKDLLIGESIAQVFDGFINSENSDLRGFWRHCYTAALAARKIAVMTDYPHLEEAYLAGLLHDVGRLALLSTAPQEYETLLSHIDDAGLCLAEKQTFAITHPEAGARMVEQFALDSFLADSILYHHQPVAQVVSAHPLIRIVMLADLIASHGANEPASEAAQLLFGLDADALRSICNDTEQRVQETAHYLNIDLGGTEQAMAVPYPSKRASNDANARDQLVLEVQQVILVSQTHRAFLGATTDVEVMLAVARSAKLQFGFDDVLFLMRDFEDDPALRGVALDPARQSFEEFSIPLRGGDAVSASVAQRQIVFLDATSNVHSLPEEQLFRLLRAEHMVCLPLFAGGQGLAGEQGVGDVQGFAGDHGLMGQHAVGVMIGGISAYRLAEIRSRSGTLRAFAAQAALAIDNVRVKAAEFARIAEKYHLAARWVVHEASNPLSIIKNYLAVLDAKVTRKESVQTEVAILSQEIDRVSQILRGLSDIQLQTSVHREPSGEKIGINQVVEEVINFLQVTAFVPPFIHLETRLHPETGGIKVDNNVLKQILVNLIKNAVEAIQEKTIQEKTGHIVVATPGFINRDGRLYTALTVQDNGPGIAPPILAKLFSPVRSAKSGDHAGLGLSIVHNLVQKLEGIIMCRSNGAGTTFELLLPVVVDVNAGSGNEVLGDAELEQVVAEKPSGRKHTGGKHGRN